MELSSDHRMLTLHNISRNDTGHYQCESRNSAASSISDPVLVKVISEAPDSNLQPALLRTAIPGGGIAEIMLGVLIGVALTGTAGYFVGVMRSQSRNPVAFSSARGVEISTSL